MVSVTLNALIHQLHSSSQEEVYDWLGFDYASQSSSPERRQDFASQFDWMVDPTDELVRRLFNQINTYYAERWCLEHTTAEPRAFLPQVNRATLYRQGKHVGFRERGIEFGIRVHLDVLDPYRRWRWLRGAHTEFVASMADDWGQAIEVAPRTLDCALALAMSLIAIHPFSDANGRAGRLAFSWLCRRWGLDDMWLAEGDDGEVLRTGTGINSTEYLMAMFMIKLMDGRNVVEPGEGGHERQATGRMQEAMRLSLASMGSPGGLIQSDQFTALKQHWIVGHHLRASTPRFECLKQAIR